MSRQSDLVRDSQLETTSVGEFTIHTFHESDPNSLRRKTERKEWWKRDGRIGGGASSLVWLERCTKGSKGLEVRAVKEISVLSGSRRIDCSRELEAITKFSHQRYEHCFVKSYGWYERDDFLCIAMEYLPFGSLQNHLSRELTKAVLDENESCEIVYQILEGLKYMHENEFAHRDLKPANIIVKSGPPQPWWVKIADFGISKRIEDGLGAPSTVKGTPGFMAPELFGLIVNPAPKSLTDRDQYAIDMWALGEIAHRMLTGKQAFPNLGSLVSYAAQPAATLPLDAELLRCCTTASVDFVRALLKAQPSARPGAAAAMSHAWIQERIPPNQAQCIPVREANEPTTATDTDPSVRWTTVTGGQAIVPVTVVGDVPSATTISTQVTATEPVQHPYLNADDVRAIIEHTKATTSELKAIRAAAYENAKAAALQLDDVWAATQEHLRAVSIGHTNTVAAEGIQANASLLSLEGDEPVKSKGQDEMSHEDSLPLWDDLSWFDETIEVTASSPDIYGLTLNDLMANDSNWVVGETKLTLQKRSDTFSEEKGLTFSYARTAISTDRLVISSYSKIWPKRRIQHSLRRSAFCKAFIREFNAIVQQQHQLDSVVGMFLEKEFPDDKAEFLILKRHVEGQIRLYNHSDGSLNVAEDPEDPIGHAVQAFSHFTFERSGGRFLITGMHCVGNKLSRPAVHSLDPQRFISKRNLGEEGFKNFFLSHKCNIVCRRLGLQRGIRRRMLKRGGEAWRSSDISSLARSQASVMGYCSNVLCRKIISVERAEKSPPPFPALWCDACLPQLAASWREFSCKEPRGTAPGHMFRVPVFYYQAQGLTIPDNCIDNFLCF